MKQIKPLTNLIVVFYLVIFLVPAYWLLRDNSQSAWSAIENRYLKPFPPFPIQDIKISVKFLILQHEPVASLNTLAEQFRPNEYPKSVEAAASDLFPLRAVWLQTSHGFDRAMIELGYLLRDDSAIPAQMSFSRFRILKTRDANRSLFYFPASVRSSELKKIDETIITYNALTLAHPEVNYYVYSIEPLHQSKAHPLNYMLRHPQHGQYIEYFLSHLPHGLNFKSLRLNSFEDHQRWYFRTDHHWNIHGTLYAYDDLYQMLKENYPSISPTLPHDRLFVFPDIRYHGSLARFTAYQLRPGDIFEVALIDYPPFRILDKDGNDLDLMGMNEYLMGNYSNKPFTDHYIKYYGLDDDFHEFVFENGSNRNLLIIGDSFANSIELMLAAHYHHTYSVDIRNYPDMYFSFSDFLINHEVDDVLFLGGGSQTIMHDWTISP